MKKEAALALLAALVSALLVVIAVNASAQLKPKPVAEALCDDTGVISVSNLEKRGISVSVKKSGGAASAISGDWRELSDGTYRFTSDDMAVVDVNGGYYTVTVDRGSYGVICPAFKFSCKLINLTINSCYRRNDTFIGKFTAYSYRYDKKNEFRFEKPFMLKYVAYAFVSGKKKELTHSPEAFSPEFKSINLSRIRRLGSNTFTLRWSTPLNISRFVIRYDDCDRPKYTFYDSFECTQRPSCSMDSECLQNERCDDSFCIPISCGPCQFISNHTCADYDCCTNADCDSGYVCGTSRNCQPLICEFNEYVVGHGCETLECAEDEYIFNSSCSKLNCAKGQVAVNHICKDIICSDEESIDTETNSCKKLGCGFLKTAKSHKCVSVFSLWFGRK